MRKYEQRFEGRSNSGLRAAIRDVVSGTPDAESAARAVLSLRGTVALTAAGIATLELVAEDYRTLRATLER